MTSHRFYLDPRVMPSSKRFFGKIGFGRSPAVQKQDIGAGAVQHLTGCSSLGPLSFG